MIDWPALIALLEAHVLLTDISEACNRNHTWAGKLKKRIVTSVTWENGQTLIRMANKFNVPLPTTGCAYMHAEDEEKV